MIKFAKDQNTEYRENMRGGEGVIKIKHFFSKSEFKAKSRLCAEITVPAGSSIGLHEHGEEDEVYIVNQGEGLLDDGQKQTIVKKGDAILTGDHASHSIKNNSNEDLIMTAVIMLY